MLGIAYAEAKIDRDIKFLGTEVKNTGSVSSSTSISNANDEKMLLAESSGQLIADYVDVPELAVEIQRAVWQVERSLKAKQEYQEEKKEIEAATKIPKR